MEDHKSRQNKPQPRGSILVVALVFSTILMTMMLSFATTIHNNSAAMEQSIARARALELAQGAARLNLQQLWLDFQAQSATKPVPQDRVVWLGVTQGDTNGNRARDTNELGPAALNAKYNPTWTVFGQGEAQSTVKIYGTIPADLSYVDLELITNARVSPETQDRSGISDNKLRWMYVSVRQLVRFNFTAPSKVFDFAYFANNFGWMYDDGSGSIRIDGNIGANGDLSFAGKPLVDGYLFAALNPGLNAQGVVNGSSAVQSHTLAQYIAYVNAQSSAAQAFFAPTNPAYQGDVTTGAAAIPYGPGFSGDVTQYNKQVPLSMPYLGDLATYKAQAIAQNGKIEQLKSGGVATNPSDWVTLVDKVYGSTAGQNGMISTVDASGIVSVSNVSDQLETDPAKQERNGNVALIGTAAQPIRVTGPVVITNDLVIKGVISGQGTIYTGRNVNVVGDVTYAAPPAWKQNDATFTADLAANNTKDMVGFAVKGSVILGQYYHMARSDKSSASGMYDNGDSWGSAASYFKSGFQNSTTQAYQTDPTDAAIGYYNTTTKSFGGDYTVADGGTRFDSTDFKKKIARNYYESSFSDEYIQSIAGTKPGKIQGLFYTNHLFGGRPSNFEMLGSMVARDEGIVFDGHCYFNYDPRSSSLPTVGSRVNIFLPPTSGYRVWLWEEVPN